MNTAAASRRCQESAALQNKVVFQRPFRTEQTVRGGGTWLQSRIKRILNFESSHIKSRAFLFDEL